MSILYSVSSILIPLPDMFCYTLHWPAHLQVEGPADLQIHYQLVIMSPSAIVTDIVLSSIPTLDTGPMKSSLPPSVEVSTPVAFGASAAAAKLGKLPMHEKSEMFDHVLTIDLRFYVPVSFYSCCFSVAV